MAPLEFITLDASSVELMLQLLSDLSQSQSLSQPYLQLRDTLLAAYHRSNTCLDSVSAHSASTSHAQSDITSLDNLPYNHTALVSHGLATPAPSNSSTRQSTPSILSFPTQRSPLRTPVLLQPLSTDINVVGLGSTAWPTSPLSDIEGTMWPSRFSLSNPHDPFILSSIF